MTKKSMTHKGYAQVSGVSWAKQTTLWPDVTKTWLKLSCPEIVAIRGTRRIVHNMYHDINAFWFSQAVKLSLQSRSFLTGITCKLQHERHCLFRRRAFYGLRDDQQRHNLLLRWRLPSYFMRISGLGNCLHLLGQNKVGHLHLSCGARHSYPNRRGLGFAMMMRHIGPHSAS